MSILKFVCPISNCFDGELPCSVLTAMIKEVSRQAQMVQKNGKNADIIVSFQIRKRDWLEHMPASMAF